MDHSPVFDAALGLRAPGFISYHLANLGLFARCALHRWDVDRIFAAGQFAVEEIAFNTLYAIGLRSVGRLCAILGDPEAAAFTARAASTEAAIIARCRFAGDGLFYSLHGREETPLRVKTVASLLPIMLESLPAAHAAGIVDHLRNPASFAAPFPVPSVAQDEPSFAPNASALRVHETIFGRLRRPYARYQLVWRGPTWVNTNWFLARGLRQHGYHALADDLATRTADMVARAGFWEFYHPCTGRGLGAENFAWSTLVVDMLDAMEEQSRDARPTVPASVA